MVLGNEASYMAKTRTKSSGRWLERQRSDIYVQQAKEAGYRSRSAYKLLEIQNRDKLFAKGMRVVDLGAAPGGWSQVAMKYVGQTGKVVAIDILPMDSINGVDIILGDVEQPEVLTLLIQTLKGETVDLVISDMAPNLSGIASVDQARGLALAEMAVLFVEKILRKDGNFLIKVFQGAGFEDFVAELKQQFNQVVVRKPKASRLESREVYLLAKGFKPGISSIKDTRDV